MGGQGDMTVMELTDVKRAALRLEMADGRIHSLTHGSGDPSDIEKARFDRESERNAFRLALQDATGLDPDSVARLLAQIGRAHVCTPVTNAHLVCTLLFEKKT